MNILSRFLCAGAALAILGVPVRADATFDRKAVVERVAELVDELYVDPTTAKAMSEHLLRKLAEGAFDSCAAPFALADALTRALREVVDDKHVNVRFGGESAGAPASIVRRGPGAAGEGPPPAGGRRIVVRPNETPADGRDRAPERSSVARVERLEGNVGYLAISGFSPSDRNREAMASAMSLLEDADALIVDVGHCPGGAPSAVVFLESYFFGPEPRELISRYDRPTGNTEHEFTLKELPGKRRTDVPLFIIAGPDTGSACESFAYTLQKHGRAAVVGTRTAGAGYNNVLMPVGEGFTLSVSVAKPVHPKTGSGWEGTGVLPDVAAARAAGAGKAAAPLATYAGNFGTREVTAAEGGLFYRNAGGRLAGPLVPVARDQFLFQDQMRLTFDRAPDGTVSALTLERPDGTRERVEKGASGAVAACAGGKAN